MINEMIVYRDYNTSGYRIIRRITICSSQPKRYSVYCENIRIWDAFFGNFSLNKECKWLIHHNCRSVTLEISQQLCCGVAETKGRACRQVVFHCSACLHWAALMSPFWLMCDLSRSRQDLNVYLCEGACQAYRATALLCAQQSNLRVIHFLQIMTLLSAALSLSLTPSVYTQFGVITQMIMSACAPSL